MPVLRQLPRLSARKAALVFVIASLAPLALLTFSSVTLAEDAVRHEVVARVRTTSAVSASLVELEMQSVSEVVQAYATRTLLVRSVGTGDHETYDMDVVDFQVGELLSSRPGFVGAFLTDASCRLWSVRPATPEIVGESFAHRDWCRGVRASGMPYVSEAYRTAIEGNQLVVAAAVPVRARDDDGVGEPLAYLTAIYDLNEVRLFVAELAEAQGIGLTIVDQRGTVLADESAASAATVLYARESDPLLTDAFAGRAEVTETELDGERVLVATAPVADRGWVVMADVPAEEALAGVSALRGTVLRVAGVLVMILLAGSYFLVRALRLRQVAEDTVLAGEARTRGILDAASDAFVAMGADGLVTSWNAAAVELFGWTSHEAIGRRLSELIVPPEQRATHDDAVERFLRTGQGRILNQRIEVEAVDRQGRTFPVELALTAARANGSWMFNAFLHDITDRKNHERELAEARDQALEASRLKSEFLANMSHEIRTPMNGVLGMTSLLLETELDPAQRDEAETVLRSGESLLAIINDILDFSKIEAGRLDLETIEFGTQHLIDDAIGVLSVRAAEKRIELVAYVYPDVPARVKGDPGRLGQVLTNLLSNAIKFTDAGEVVVEVSAEPPRSTPATESQELILRFDVTDTGIGVDENQQKAIFESFTQADSSTTRRYGGTGLGLAISHQLVTLMDGDIGVRSEPGKGSTFWFTVPVTVGEPLDHRPRRDDLRGARVLVVDDNATNRLVLRRMLESWGVEHRDAPDAPSALRAMHEAATDGHPFDAALVDLHMPDVDGLTLASQIAAHPSLASTALVLLTSSAQRGEAGLAEAAGMAGYLAKPVHPTQLHTCLATVLSSEPSAAGRVPLVTRHRLATDVPTRRGTILLAEDNPVNQRVACGILKRLGYRVHVTSNGHEAVAAAVAGSFDVILMDCQMPEMDGYEATRRIRAAEGPTRRTPIVAVTASAMQQDRQRCLDAGMDEHLAKPLRRDELAVMLDRFAHGRAPDGGAHGEPVDGTHAPVADLQASIRSRLDDLFDGFDGDIEADGAELLESFLRRAADEIDRVAEALAVGDAALVRQRAHSLKGMAANVGVDSLARCAGEVEEAARDGRLEAVLKASDDLRDGLLAAERTIHAMYPLLAALP